MNNYKEKIIALKPIVDEKFAKWRVINEAENEKRNREREEQKRAAENAAKKFFIENKKKLLNSTIEDFIEYLEDYSKFHVWFKKEQCICVEFGRLSDLQFDIPFIKYDFIETLCKLLINELVELTPNFCNFKIDYNFRDDWWDEKKHSTVYVDIIIEITFKD